ncbi:hypothetical protein [Rubrobacter aplysinae]|uniref:hypothetical protein n=1 Tax=Rubrobacter aplysinae TaxID=909625 RepID=UPI00064C10EB|nr:hypothetical protein [Rubrobacter aplysinae]
MNRELVEKVVDEARSQESKLVISDRRDTFTLESKDVANVELGDDYLKVKMEDDKATVYVEFESIFKLVLEEDRSARSSSRAGFGATRS